MFLVACVTRVERALGDISTALKLLTEHWSQNLILTEGYNDPVD